MLSIKDPFTFEFLGLDARDAVSMRKYGEFIINVKNIIYSVNFKRNNVED